MATRQCKISLSALVGYLLVPESRGAPEVREHLERTCGACISRLRELRTVLERRWLTNVIYLN